MTNTKELTINVELTVNGEKITDVLKRIEEGLEVIATPKEGKPEKLVPTKPYKQLVAYYSNHCNKTIWGVFTGIDGDKVMAHWNGSFYYDPDGHMPLGRIIAVEDIIIHEPKENNLSAAQELSVQQELSIHQESANFAHAAVQGIINAHAEKNGEKAPESMKCSCVGVLLDKFYTEDEFNDYGELQYMRGRGDERRALKRFTFSDFDKSVLRTWKKQDFKDAVSNAALGLSGEAGEVSDLIKKAIYHERGFSLKDNPNAILKYDVLDELSDVLYYVSAQAQNFGFSLEEVAKHNKAKLEKRFPEGFSTEASARKRDKTAWQSGGSLRDDVTYWGGKK